MGQYQEWLLAQEIDRQLKAEVEALETEILYLKDRIAILEQTVPETENVILQVLLTYLRGQTQTQTQSQGAASKNESAPHAQEDWTALPQMETSQTPVAESAPYFPGMYSQLERLPGDVLTLFEEHKQAGPNSWLRKRRRINNEDHHSDTEAQSLDENIQRWFERWQREITSMALSEGKDEY